eukprot:2925157-Prymnesium_polylepis.1
MRYSICTCVLAVAGRPRTDLHSECMRATYRTHTRGRDTAECGARGPQVYVEHASVQSSHRHVSRARGTAECA